MDSAADRLKAALKRETETARALQAARAETDSILAEIGAVRRKNRDEFHKGLTPREAGVLILVRERLVNKEIGAKLNISVSAVKKHIASLMKKLGCVSRGSL